MINRVTLLHGFFVFAGFSGLFSKKSTMRTLYLLAIVSFIACNSDTKKKPITPTEPAPKASTEPFTLPTPDPPYVADFKAFDIVFEALPASDPSIYTREQILNFGDDINRAGSILKPYVGTGKDSITKEANKRRDLLIKKQKAILPKMRKVWSDYARQELWEKNVKVKQNGTTLELQHYSFANNKNIKDALESLEGALKKLRFQRFQLRWYDGGDITYYDLKNPKDGEL